ncbi:MAG: hypothetical protein COA79_02485 [Planctomycetota bacterium]|nr:MAG: hypothetical protein COA79_02485 [Planctomycetota bacterium]
MKIAIVGDLHLADKEYADDVSYQSRHHYINQHEYVRKQINSLNENQPDHVILLGDLIDWFSLENIDFALEVFSKLQSSWDMTIGNHDVQLPVSHRPEHNKGVTHKDADATVNICRKKALAGWADRGICVQTRKVELGQASFYFLDSALGYISEEDQLWLIENIVNSSFNIIITHVPFPFEETIKLLKENHKDCLVYSQQNLSDQFIEKVLSSVNFIFSGHVHFTANYKESDAAVHFIKNANEPISDSKDNGIFYLEV